ncbi:hypothetical protein M8998_15815 [Sphingobacterium sp. lm-10]|uniref:hypothetical protein n=1 Tax=Sphingobacterium sp. lm-10 TaxID=2944904 RepID=UPI0020228874|nr:hypothetical protein [Sphingobacterium sp. lm-10]MCL7989417.1 hypothetical protein [Sphingobacterium sp. lm-10]
MNWKLLLLACCILPAALFGQHKQKKPLLLVYGEGAEAFSAALQSALSNVPTIWVTPGDAHSAMNTDEAWSIPSDYHLDGGIWMKLLMETGQHNEPNDSVAALVKKHITPGQLWQAAEVLLQKVPQLTIFQQTTVNKISLGRRGWQVLLSNRKRYDLRSIVDASEKQTLMIRIPTLDRQQEHTEEGHMGNLQTTRTILAVGEDRGEIHLLTAKQVFDNVKNNFFTLYPLHALASSPENIGLRMQFGQAIGAAAAYTAFFRTTVDKIDLRKLQSELLTYQSRLFPAVDVATEDPHFNSWQKIYLTGLFALDDHRFKPQKKVHYAEIQPVLDQLYSRSQLWFIDHGGEELLWKDAIELVKFLGVRGQEVNRQIAEEWSRKLQFEGSYDPERPITRGELSVLLDQFANPYGISVTHSGEVRR